ncbi:hypothetical protein J3F83DRAFT_269940 [Trichoderma novae-zelandiae]
MPPSTPVFLAQARVAEGIDGDSGKRSTGGIGLVACIMLAKRRVNKGKTDLEGDLFVYSFSCMPSDGIITHLTVVQSRNSEQRKFSSCECEGGVATTRHGYASQSLQLGSKTQVSISILCASMQTPHTVHLAIKSPDAETQTSWQPTRFGFRRLCASIGRSSTTAKQCVVSKKLLVHHQVSEAGNFCGTESGLHSNDHSVLVQRRVLVLSPSEGGNELVESVTH